MGREETENWITSDEWKTSVLVIGSFGERSKGKLIK
jgi:hypothetical protein